MSELLRSVFVFASSFRVGSCSVEVCAKPFCAPFRTSEPRPGCLSLRDDGKDDRVREEGGRPSRFSSGPGAVRSGGSLPGAPPPLGINNGWVDYILPLPARAAFFSPCSRARYST